MDISNKKIDNGRAFDWGRTSAEYAKFRDIYPGEFYARIAERGLCIKGQDVPLTAANNCKNLAAVGGIFATKKCNVEKTLDIEQGLC